MKMSKPTTTTTTKKSTKRAAQEQDPFAAALCAVDKVRTKVSKRQRESSFFAEVERSLANSVRAAASTARSSSSSTTTAAAAAAATSENETHLLKSRSISHKVYAGRRKPQPFNGVVPRLFDICIRFCIKHIDDIDKTGDIPFHVLRPVLEKCSHSQLARLESKNRYLEEDTDYLWERHCRDVFPSEEREDESWKHCFFRLTYEREDRLRRLSAKIGSNNRVVVQPQRKAMLADPIAPRDARRRQVKNGTIVHSSAVPNAADLSRSRRQIFETGNDDALKKVHPAVRNVGRANDSAASLSRPSSAGDGPSSSSASNSMGAIFAVRKAVPKKGALMVKALKMMKARRK